MKLKKFICLSAIVCIVSLNFLGCKAADSKEKETSMSETQSSTSAAPQTSETPTLDAEKAEEKTPDEIQLAESDDTPNKQALEQYKIVLSQADSYQYDSTGSSTPTGNYRYALVQMQSSNTAPALLLSQETQNGLYFIRIFQYNPDDHTMSQPLESLAEGTAEVGGFRGSLGIMKDGNGLSLSEVSSGTGDMSVSRVTLEGGSIRTLAEWQGRLGDSVPETLSSETINWNDISNTDTLDNWTADINHSPKASDTTEKTSEEVVLSEGDEISEETTLPEDGGKIVFQGTINNYSYDQVLTLQGISDPNGGSPTSMSYQLIVLDTPQVMELRSGGDPGTQSGEVSIIRIHGNENLSQYHGQHLTFSIDPNQTYWPSDTSLPLGQPSTSDIKILN